MKSFLKNYKKIIATAFLVVAVVAIGTSQAATPILDSAANFAVLAGSGVSSTGATTSSITGDVGSSPTAAIVGLLDTDVIGTVYRAAEAPVGTAKVDLTTAYTALAAYGGAGTDLTGLDLGNRTLFPGIYSMADTTAYLNGALTLDAQGNNGAFWIFKLANAFTTGANNGSSVQVTHLGSNNGSDVGVFWLVGSSATLGTYTEFVGNILADQSITLNTGATILNGRALAQVAHVTLDTNIIRNVCPAPNNGPGFSGGLEFDSSGNVVPVPEPATICLLGLGALGLIRKKRA